MNLYDDNDNEYDDYEQEDEELEDDPLDDEEGESAGGIMVVLNANDLYCRL